MEAANDNRPAEFDARVMAYVPGLKRLAGRRVPREYRDDLVTDTIMYALAHWKNFREDGGMWNWLEWSMRGILKNAATKAANRKKNLKFVPIEDHMNLSTPATQLAHADLSKALDGMTGRGGKIVVRRALGHSLREIGDEMGMTSERVRQLEAREMKRLKAVRAG
ncbi:sigma-70 family RNA polymerase sigma factor [Rhizobium aethiopicum]|uniref:RNA polymerase sigma factor (Sigma-70 family) n=1 Tax=Rhizobium aethiopicum TaxID=1138170 RepID=A0A7W6MHD1_9HYPH|nr:sigma-70 family RNA polymerase sigma factor [Rhizobium aethiopicum]MBB4192764.1 RNA polymerase sigma factor (sigma-70 family) [Rhizobium aethiopicum]